MPRAVLAAEVTCLCLDAEEGKIVPVPVPIREGLDEWLGAGKPAGAD